MKVKNLLAALLAFSMLFGLSGCKLGFKDKDKDIGKSSSSEPEKVDPNWPVKMGDVTISEKPSAIVSLSPSLTELIFELGGDGQLAGVSDFCDYPDAADDLPRCGTAQLLDRDAIEKAEPSLVLASSKLSQEDLVWIQQQGADVLVLSRAGSIDDLEERYITLGTIFGGKVDGEKNGADTFAKLRARYDALVYAARGIADLTNGIYLRAVPLLMATGDTFEGELLTSIGIKNDAQEFTGWEYPADKAVDLYPKVIFYDASIDPEYFKGTQVYNTTDAYKAQKMYPVDGIAFERQSERMFVELEKMFAAAYPDVTVQAPSEPESDPSEQELTATREVVPPEEPGSASAADDGMLEIGDATEIKEK